MNSSSRWRLVGGALGLWEGTLARRIVLRSEVLVVLGLKSVGLGISNCLVIF